MMPRCRAIQQYACKAKQKRCEFKTQKAKKLLISLLRCSSCVGRCKSSVKAKSISSKEIHHVYLHDPIGAGASTDNHPVKVHLLIIKYDMILMTVRHSFEHKEVAIQT